MTHFHVKTIKFKIQCKHFSIQSHQLKTEDWWQTNECNMQYAYFNTPTKNDIIPLTHWLNDERCAEQHVTDIEALNPIFYWSFSMFFGVFHILKTYFVLFASPVFKIQVFNISFKATSVSVHLFYFIYQNIYNNTYNVCHKW